ncbi:penicillin-binding protein 2 [Undibacterium sp. BYS107W]|uniref:Peptidoglycan D,D-transpeptidase FtsI n=1 Tax=Undibacterium baiyunense TaxID=2828731 RepID=A0A941DEJ0_9BURK|nr:penicillin-binding protein 2 [Undibacterium baiyunense]
MLFFLFIAFVALIVRALWLQGMSTEFLQKQGASRYARTLELSATRGKIVDRHGQVLASSVPVKAIWASSESVLEAPPEKIAQLAALLDMSEQELRKKLVLDKQFVYLKRQAEQALVDKVLALNIAGVKTEKEYKRFYPEGEVMAHVVGFTNVEDKGQEGIELASEKNLAGKTGSRRVIKDRLGRVVEDIESVRPPHDGKDMQLSVDSKIQYIAYTHLKDAVEKFKAKAGGAVVLNVQTGEILALVNLPTYNPNDRSVLTGAQLRNRVITDTFEPGSTMKPFPVALALDTGRVKPDTLIETAPGHMTIGSATIHDAHKQGTLTVAGVIQKSSNIGTAKMALQIPPKEMWEMFASLGFGQQPNIGFPGAVAGRMRNYKTWKPIEQATMSYGHGMSVSLLQIARAYMIFARKGDMIPLTFQQSTATPVGTRIISEETAMKMREMLESVTQPGGTATQARVPGYRVAGKTGTAHKIEHGKYVNKYIGDFVGFAPVSNPRIIVAVMIDEPSGGVYYGGSVAGPVFAAITANVLRSMNVVPDSSVMNIIPEPSVQESL